MSPRLFCLFASLALLTACGSNPYGSDGFQHPAYPVSVAATEGRILSSDWLVDEWTLDANERPVRRQRVYGVHLSDLALRHRTNEGRIWMDVISVQREQRDQELRVWADRIVSSVNSDTVKFRGQAMRQIATDSIAIDGHPAHLVILEAGDGHQGSRGAVVLLRANFRQESPRAVRLVPVLLVVGYANSAVDFEGGLDDFRRFLSSLDIAPSVASAHAAPASP